MKTICGALLAGVTVLLCGPVRADDGGTGVDPVVIPELELEALPGDAWRVRVTGRPEAEFHLEGTADLLGWLALERFSMSGRGEFETTVEGVAGAELLRARELPLPAELGYLGDTMVLVVPGLAAGTVLELDLDGDGQTDASGTADDEGLLSVLVNMIGQPDTLDLSYRTQRPGDAAPNPAADVRAIRKVPVEFVADVPESVVGDFSPMREPGICACDIGVPDPFGLFSNTFTPVEFGVELATGMLRQSFEITDITSRGIDFDLTLNHASLVTYDGPFGCGMSHSYHFMVVRTGELTGTVVTPDLRRYEISSENGLDWVLPEGFFSQLKYDPTTSRWRLTHFSGVEIEFFEGLLGQPGLPLWARDPNGNRMRFGYDAAGRLAAVATPLRQVQRFAYGADGRLESFTDHVGHRWTFGYDEEGCLATIATPAAEHLPLRPGDLFTAEDVSAATVVAPRVTTIAYVPGSEVPGLVQSVTDGRGAVVEQFSYDANGRCVVAVVNGAPAVFDYAPGAVPVAPLAVLDPGNLWVRVVDREGNVTDNEVMGPGTAGEGGLRRTVEWTASGLGGAPLRAGEPSHWETRWLHDCLCLKAVKVSETFRGGGGGGGRIAFDADGMPTNRAVTAFTFTPFRQPLVELYSDGTNTIREEWTYQAGAFGEGGEFSLPTSETEPRAFGGHPLYTGLDFTTHYEYDDRGNLERTVHPSLTLGQDDPVPVIETRAYNAHGQEVLHVDANGNRTVTTYHTAAGPASGDVNTQAGYAGYPASVTEGAPGSADGDLGLTTSYLVNPLGDVTRTTDPRGYHYDIVYNALREEVREIDPPVDLPGDAPVVQYETQYVYDAAGNVAVERRSNIGASGVTAGNALVDVSRSYDVGDNVLAEAQEVDGNPANDLVTLYAYDKNERLAAVALPEGNRTFSVFDERDLLLREFIGVEPGPSLLDGFPDAKTDTTLSGGVKAVGAVEYEYDARGDLVRETDPRGGSDLKFYDFARRVTATLDPNGNGEAYSYDAASNVLVTRGGAISPATGEMTVEEERLYHRTNELGLEYQQVEDLNLATDESGLTDPAGEQNPSRTTLYDAGLRTLAETDAEGNVTRYRYDSANRTVESEDALGNLVKTEYDANGNEVRVVDCDVSGLERSEEAATTYVYDCLNRLVERHLLGEEGSGIDHVRRYGYDSRSNVEFDEDELGLTRLSIYDDADRLLSERRFAGNPVTGGGVAPMLQSFSWGYDRNDNVVEERVLGDVGDLGSLQVTKYAYDLLDRRVLEVQADSDDPADGSGDGADGVFDRTERVFDANSNLVSETDPRGVQVLRTYDPGDRLTSEVVVPVAGVTGETRRLFTYDALDRMLLARNDFVEVAFSYDALSRLVSETQSLAPGGTGFFTGYRDPVVTSYTYDLEDNQTSMVVTGAGGDELTTATGYDALNRPVVKSASYLGKPEAVVQTYDWIGDGRFSEVGHGNGAVTRYAYDGKRRVVAIDTEASDGTPLTSYSYTYDAVDNVLSEASGHDAGRVDRFTYDALYQLTGVDYRGLPGEITPIAPADQFAYDSVFNRVSATFGDPFGLQPQITETYERNRANEYTQVVRNRNQAAHLTDRAGNTTEMPVRPANPIMPFFVVTDEPALMNWDGFNRLTVFQTLHSPNPVRVFLRDALGRRCVRLENSGGQTVPVRRYCFARDQVVCDRAFTPGSTVQNFGTVARRLYVCGAEVGSRVLCAQDGDGNGEFAKDGSKNQPNPNGGDAEYYYYRNLRGDTGAIGDADNQRRVMEFCKTTPNGETVVLPELEFGGVPNDLQDNTMLASRSSLYGNRYCYAGFRCEPQMGLLYCERSCNYYEPSASRYLRRCTAYVSSGSNCYQYGGNNCWNRSRSTWVGQTRTYVGARKKARKSWRRHVWRYKRRWWRGGKRLRCLRGCGFRRLKRSGWRKRKWKKRKRKGWRRCRWGYRPKRVCRRYRTWKTRCRSYRTWHTKCKTYRTWKTRCRSYRVWRTRSHVVWKKRCKTYYKRNYVCSTWGGKTRCVRWSSRVVKCKRYRKVVTTRSSKWKRSCWKYIKTYKRCYKKPKVRKRCWKVPKSYTRCHTRWVKTKICR